MSAQTSHDADTLSVVAQLVVSVFTLVFALDAVGAALSYREFRGKAERAEARARDLLSSGPVDEIAAVKIMQEYHVARATAPLIPTSVWRLHRGRLDELWDDYRAGR